MDAVIKVINIIGSGGAVVGIVWSLIGAYQFFQGRKNSDKNRMDDGLEGIINGALIGIVVKGLATAGIAALQGITF